MLRLRRQLPRTPRMTPSTVNARPRLLPRCDGDPLWVRRTFHRRPPDRDPQPVRSFAVFTADLYRLAEWLTACQVTTMAMEAAGVYRIRSVASSRAAVSRCSW
jgi:transposase